MKPLDKKVTKAMTTLNNYILAELEKCFDKYAKQSPSSARYIWAMATRIYTTSITFVFVASLDANYPKIIDNSNYLGIETISAPKSFEFETKLDPGLKFKCSYKPLFSDKLEWEHLLDLPAHEID